MKRDVNTDDSQDDGLADIDMNRTDQHILLLVSFLALVFAIIGFSMSEAFTLFLHY